MYIARKGIADKANTLVAFIINSTADKALYEFRNKKTYICPYPTCLNVVISSWIWNYNYKRKYHKSDRQNGKTESKHNRPVQRFGYIPEKN